MLSKRLHSLLAAVWAVLFLLAAMAYPGAAAPRTANAWRAINTGLPGQSYNDLKSLAVDPLDPNILYAGSAPSFGMARGVYKSTNGGVSWFASDSGLPTNALIAGLYIDPTHTSTLYARNDQKALYKSVNAGQTWSKLTILNPSLEDVWAVAVYGSTLYVGGYLDAYISTNGGDTWDKTFSSPGGGTFNALWIDPADTAHVIAAVGSSLYQTINSGHNWTHIDTLMGSACDTAYTVALDVDPSNPNNILVGTWFCIARTTDGGAHWTNVHNMGYVNNVLFDPRQPGIAYATSSYLGPSTVIKSTDGGATWNPYDSGLHPGYQVQALALGPSNAGVTSSAVYTASYGYGVYTTNPPLYRLLVPYVR